MSVGGIGDTSGLTTSSLTGPMTAADALNALRRHAVSSVQIVDTVQNIAKNLDALQGYASKVTALTTTDSNQKMVVTGAQYQKDRSIIGVWGAGTGQTLGITGALASAVGSLGSYVTSVSVADSSANIARNLDSLQTLAAAGTLSEIVQTGSPGNLTLTSAQLGADQGALDKIKNHGYTLAITNASVSDTLGLGSAPALSANSKIKSISIVDTTDAIASNLDALQRVGLRVKSIAQTDATTPMTVTGQQYKNDQAVLGKFITSDMLAVIDASAVQTKNLAADHKVVTVGITDTAANIARNWTLMETLASSLTSVQVSDQSNAIHVTAGQLAGSSALLGKFTDTADHSYQLEVTGVSASAAAATAGTHNVAAVDVSDSAANVVAGLGDLETLNTAGKLNSVTLSGQTPLFMDVSLLQGSQLTATQGILDKIKGHNYTLGVTGATAASLSDLAANKRVVSVAVSDSSANIQASLDTLRQLGTRLAKIDQTDVGTAFALTQTQLDSSSKVLSKIAGGYTANLTEVTASKATADESNTHVASIAVSDSGRNIAAYWAQLRAIGSDLTSVTQSDSAAISMSADNYQLGVHDNLVAKLGSASSFFVTGASVDQAQAISGDQAVSQIDVAANGQSIVDNLSTLADLATGGKLHAIVNQTPSVSLAMDASQLGDAQPVLDLIKGGSYSLAVGGVDVGDAKDLVANNHKIASVAVTGDAADIVTNLSDLTTLGRKLTTITQTDAPAATLAMTGDAFEQNASTLAKIDGGFLADLSDVSAAKAATLASNTSVSTIAVSDSGAHLASAWNALGEVGAKLTTVDQNDSATLQLGANDWLNGQDLRGKFSSDPTVSVSGADVSQVAGLAADDAVTAIQVSGTASALSGALGDLAGVDKVTQVTVQDPTNAMTITGQTYSDSASLLGLFKNGQYKVALSDVTAADGETFASDAHVVSMDVSDSSSEVSAHFAALAAATNLDSIALTDSDGTVTASTDQVLGDSGILDKIVGSYQLAVTGAAMADLPALQDVPEVSSVSISDTSDNVSANFGDVLALGGALTQIHLSDSSPVLALSEQDWTAGSAALGTIDGAYQVDLSNTVAGDAQTAAADNTVRSVSVADTASDVAGQWDALVSLYNGGAGKLTGISMTDDNSLVLTADQQVAGAAMISALLPDQTIETAP